MVYFRYISLLMVLCSTMLLPAQEIPSRQNDGVQRAASGNERNGIAEQLNLSPKQKKEFDAIQKATKTEVQAIRRNEGLTPLAKKDSIKRVLQRRNSERNDLLTTDQKQLLKQYNKKEKNAESNKKVALKDVDAKGKDANGLAKNDVDAKLPLSPGQKEKMDELNHNFKREAASIRQNNDLTEEDKKAKLQQLRKETQKQRRAILTHEQWMQWRSANVKRQQKV